MTRAVFAIIALAALAASVAANAGPPDLSGVWSVLGTHAVLTTLDGTPPPLTAGAKAAYEQHRAAAARGDRSFDSMSRCLPPGLPRLMLVREPFEILQRDKVVYFVHQLNRLPRRIYLDEKLPDDPDPIWLGYSVGHWDGAALVIESAGFNDSTVLDDSGLPHSTDLRLTERYELKADGQHLHARFTIDDPKTFIRPWTTEADFVRKPGYEIPEEVCADKLAPRQPPG
jgi:hypothetical protein